MTDIDGCGHIACVSTDHVWISDRYKLVLTNTTGETKHSLMDIYTGFFNGVHTVNSESELIYIDKDHYIKKLSTDMKTTTIFIEKKESKWKPRCVYWSSSSRNLLVGLTNFCIGKVTRYNRIGQLIQTIQQDSSRLNMFKEINYLTENNNGDIVVSDYMHESGAVVVTAKGGRRRFSYTGNPSGSGLQPNGICTDAMSNIIVCDDRTDTVQLLDKDGQFLSKIMTKSEEMRKPHSVSYDAINDCLWVGLEENKLCAFFYMTEKNCVAGKSIYFFKLYP